MEFQRQRLTNAKGKTFSIKKLNATEKRYLQFKNAQYLSERIPLDPKILGLDLAKYKTGYTLLQMEQHKEKNQIHHLETGLISCKKSLTVQTSVFDFYEQIYALLERHRPNIIAYEYIAVATELSGFKALAKVEAALQIAIHQIYPEDERPLLLPISVMTAKKIALLGQKPDADAAKQLAEELGMKKKLDKRTLDKLSIMKATELNYGMKFTDDNECDSFLVANCAVAISSFICDTHLAGHLNEFDDTTFIRVIKDAPKQKSLLKKTWNEIAVNFIASSFPVKENSIEQYQATVKEIKSRFYNIVEESDPNSLEFDDDSDD